MEIVEIDIRPALPLVVPSVNGGPDVEKAQADFGPLSNAKTAAWGEYRLMSFEPVRSRLYLLPVAAPDKEWPRVRRYRLVRLRERSLPERLDQRGSPTDPTLEP